MQVIQVCSSESICVSSKLENISNKTCNDLLEIGSYKDRSYECIKSEALIKFEFDCLNIANLNIKKVFLNLNICKWSAWIQKSEYELVISANEEEFDSSWIDWETKPKKNYYKTIKITRQSLENNLINIDITELAERWIKGEIPNYGITLEFKEPEILIYCASNCLKIGPKLIVYCQCKKTKCLSGVEAIEISVANRAMELIENDSPVKFDTIAKQIGNEIEYDKENLEIVIKEAGVYSAQWWISIDGSGDIGEIAFKLVDSLGKNESLCSVPVFVLSQVFGNGILKINTAPCKIKLINKSGASIQYANVTVQANFTMFKI